MLLFYCHFDQINAALVCIRDFFQKHIYFFTNIQFVYNFFYKYTNFYLMKTYLFICIIFLNTQILPGVKVIIANTETKGPLGDSHLGEVSVKYESE